MIHAAFANTEYKLKKLTAVLGLRGEQITQKYREHTVRCNRRRSIRQNGILPSLVMKYELNSKQNLRLGLSKTYTLPI
jgi:outer membrane receptor protein involved in Fe transport